MKNIRFAFTPILMLSFMIVSGLSFKTDFRPPEKADGHNNLGLRNLERATAIIDTAMSCFFSGEDMVMSRYYNPETLQRSKERGSVWMYTSAIESVNAVLHGLKLANQNGYSELYDSYFLKYTSLLDRLYQNADFYLGTFSLTSFTQTRVWSVYAVDRVNKKGEANVKGVLNVYDDQIWLIKELLESYNITGNEEYLTKAEYLTAYVLDGWDTTVDEEGNENGGIPWGPGYVTKHACSNSPLISPLIRLHRIYADKEDKIVHRFIDINAQKTRTSVLKKKASYYLDYARDIYAWQKSKLLSNEGVYVDMMGGCGNCEIDYEVIAGVRYRVHTPLTKAVGEHYSYNSGTMISGGVDLFHATGDLDYLKDAKALSDASFDFFTQIDKEVSGYYSYETDGFRNWFNGVLLRGFTDIYPEHNIATSAIQSFQSNLDYGYLHFRKRGLLPTNLLLGWAKNASQQKVEGMFQFTFATEYALLASYELRNLHN